MCPIKLFHTACTVCTFVVLLCFTAVPPAANATDRVDDRELARLIVAESGVEGGLIVHVGCADGKITAALRANERFLVQGLDTDADRVAEARTHIQSLGIYGKVCVDRWTGDRLPYADNVVNLLVMRDAGCEIREDEITRVLVPRGVAIIHDSASIVRKEDSRIPQPASRNSHLASRISSPIDGYRTKLVKPWPDDIDEWTHWLRNASGNAVARDRVVGPPEQLQWAVGPLWSRHHNTTPSFNAAVSARARIFYIADEAAPEVDNSLPDRYSLFARDAFNGVLLWKIPIEDWGWKAWVQTMYSNFMLGRHMHPTQIQRRLVAVDDRVYATLGFNEPVVELDAATGEVLRTFAGTKHTSEILWFDGKLVLAVNREPQRAGFLDKDPPVKKQVKIVDLATGKMLWETGDFVGVSVRGSSVQRVTQLTMAVGPEGVFVVEERELVGLDLKTGDEMWRVPRPPKPEKKVVDGYRNDHTNLCTLVYHDGRALFGQPREQSKKPPWNTTQLSDLLAIDAKKGDVLWSKEIGSWEYGTPIGIYVIDGLIWVHASPDEPYTLLALDPANGKEQRRIPTAAALNSGHHHRCTRNKATERFLITSRRGVELTDLSDGTTQVNQWIRGECGYGMLTCNGLIYTTPHPCRCFIEEKLAGLYALAPGSRVEGLGSRAGGERLEKGAAYVELGVRNSERGTKDAASESSLRTPRSALRASSIPHSNDWPTYRGDAARSGSSATNVPAELKSLWQADLGAPPSAPVVAGGRVFVSVVDQHRVCALSQADGSLLWDFIAGGVVDTPPTIYGDLALFGSRDGCLYCLRASDGELVWRLRAAPGPRRLVAFDQLESAWPLFGSVLVVDGVAYAAAGRSSHLDGGIHVLAVDPVTGDVLREDIRSTALADSQQGGQKGSLPDILVFDGQAIRMRQQSFPRVNPSSESKKEKPLHLLATGGLLDDTWFNRIYWAVGGRQLGQYLVFDEKTAYGIRAYTKPGDVNAHFTPGRDGYLLFASDHNPPKPPAPKGQPAAKKPRRGEPVRDRWAVRMPIRSQSMALTDGVLFVAGTPDVVDPDDPWAAFDGRQGGLLWSVSTADGKTLAEYKLDSPPVYDGLAAARSQLFLSTREGKVICLGE